MLAENVPDAKIHVTGNTVIDALLWVRDRVRAHAESAWRELFGEDLYARIRDDCRRLVLITGHRRESFGRGFQELCQAVRVLADAHHDWDFIYPVHLNPNVRSPVNAALADLDNVHLIEPLDYAPFVWLMSESDLILTDSGGIQEEAPSLGKPVLVTRNVTERPEAVEAGTVRLVGTDGPIIIEAVEELFQDPELYKRMSTAHNPYGDGRATERIIRGLARYLVLCVAACLSFVGAGSVHAGASRRDTWRCTALEQCPDHEAARGARTSPFRTPLGAGPLR